MKTIKLEITENTFKRLVSADTIRQMKGEDGILDQAFRKILQAIDNDEYFITLQLKEELEK